MLGQQCIIVIHQTEKWITSPSSLHPTTTKRVPQDRSLRAFTVVFLVEHVPFLLGHIAQLRFLFHVFSVVISATATATMRLTATTIRNQLATFAREVFPFKVVRVQLHGLLLLL